MREFWRRFTTNLSWFIGTIFVVIFIFFFFWFVIDQVGCANKINSWLQGLKEIFTFFLVIAIMIFGVRLMFQRTFRRGNGGHH